MRGCAIALSGASFLLAAGSFLPDAAWAQSGSAPPSAERAAINAIGKVITATGSFTIEHVDAVVVQANLSRVGQAKVGDPVYMGDVVQTGADGRVAITFTDGTAFNLSSNARMVLNEFVYDPNGKSNSTLFNLTKGTFTFVAGKVAKTGDMKIETPVATMGIRGTTPHVEISEDGKVSFSTLIEENKGAIEKRAIEKRAIEKRAIEKRGSTDDNKRAASLKQRQGKVGPASLARAEKNSDKNIDVKLKICQGC